MPYVKVHITAINSVITIYLCSFENKENVLNMFCKEKQIHELLKTPEIDFEPQSIYVHLLVVVGFISFSHMATSTRSLLKKEISIILGDLCYGHFVTDTLPPCCSCLHHSLAFPELSLKN